MHDPVLRTAEWLTGAAASDDADKSASTLRSLSALPIAAAPIKSGEEFVPVLLWVTDRGGYWTLGSWDRDGWYDEDGFSVTPAYWAPFPQLPAV